MDTQFKILLGLVGLQTAINIYFLYRYSGIEYSVQTDTDVIIRKIIELENKIDFLIKE